MLRRILERTMRIYISKQGSALIVGSVQNLKSIADQCTTFLESPTDSLSISADKSGSALPYDRLLAGIKVIKKDGPINVSVANDVLQIFGSKGNLGTYCKQILFDDGAAIGNHQHPDQLSGQRDCISPNAVPVTIEVGEP